MALPVLASSATPVVATWTERDHALPESARERIIRSVPINTTRAYVRQWTRFEDWCASQGRVALPATPETLAAYMDHLASDGKGPSSLEQALAVIGTQHRMAAGYRRGELDTEAARRVIRGVKRDRADDGKRAKQAPPLVVDGVRAVLDTCDVDTAIGLRDRLLVLLGFGMMARRSELADLRIEDVTEVEDGLEVLIRKSKTDQDAKGAVVPVLRGHGDTDPVRVFRAWRDWLADQGVTSGHLFRAVTRHGTLGASGRMSGTAINKRIGELATRAGLPADYSAHSLRAGGATAAYKAGAPVSTIAKQGRWSEKSPVVLGYLRSVDRWNDHPMSKVGL